MSGIRVGKFSKLQHQGSLPTWKRDFLSLLSQLTDIKKSRRRCIPEYEPRLSRYFGTSPGLWLRLKLAFELMRTARETDTLINREEQSHAA